MKMQYGVAYYPEHKTRQELEHDCKLLIDSGINTVRMGEFAWCEFEPREGEFHFEWLDPVVEHLGKNGIQTILCTPTACPPAWLVDRYPEILYVDNRSVTRPFGGRRHYCYNNEIYRRYSATIVEKIGEHYGKNPYIAGFQIDNEPAQEVTGRCHCKVCSAKFQAWMEKKYGDIDTYNRRTGAIFWSQKYTSFNQIHPPVNTIEVGAIDAIPSFYENPSLRLDFEQFSSESNIEYQNLQTHILKRYTQVPVTTNGTGLATNSIDYYDGFRELDVYAFDYYPSLRHQEVDSFPYAFGRGVKEGKNLWVLEFMSGGGHKLNGTGRPQPFPGALKQSVLHAFACGVELMLHFQFRTYPYGAEQLNYAIVDADGVPRRRYREMQDTAKALAKLDSVLANSSIQNEIAICFDYRVHWALRIKPINDTSFAYIRYCTEFYKSLMNLGIQADVVSYQADFSKYKAVILPTPFATDEGFKERLKAYVQEGGTVLSTFLTAVKDADNLGLTQSLPAGLTDLFGIEVSEVEPVFDDMVADIELCLNGKKTICRNRHWEDILESKGAQLIGTFGGEDYRKGWGVISQNHYGRGRAYYLGTGLDPAGTSALLSHICADLGIKRAPFVFEEGVEVVERRENGEPVYFLFNFLQRETQVQLDGSYQDLLNGQSWENTIFIPMKGIAVLKKQNV